MRLGALAGAVLSDDIFKNLRKGQLVVTMDETDKSDVAKQH